MSSLKKDMINTLYYNFPNESAFAGVKSLAKASKKSLKETNEWLASQRSYTLHKPFKRKYPTRICKTKYVNQFWETDLIDMQQYKNENKSHSYILSIIDVFSRFGYAIPIKNKTPHAIVNAFRKLTENPTYLSSDQGKEFTGRVFQDYLKKKKIKHFIRLPPFKAAICERFNRTLKTRLVKYFTHAGNHRWYDMIQKVVDAYNQSFHRTIKMSPNKAKLPENKSKLLLLQEKRIKSIKNRPSKLNVGDYVRITRYKGTFEKGYTPNWSEEIFTVSAIDKKYQPLMYTIMDLNMEDIDGKFYIEELQKVKKPSQFAIEKILKTKGNKKLVKFVGYEKPEWVSSSINKISEMQ